MCESERSREVKRKRKAVIERETNRNKAIQQPAQKARQ